jgi:hypothetical protein
VCRCLTPLPFCDQQDEEYVLMQAYIKKLYQPIIKRLGWTPKGMSRIPCVIATDQT